MKPITAGQIKEARLLLATIKQPRHARWDWLESALDTIKEIRLQAIEALDGANAFARDMSDSSAEPILVSALQRIEDFACGTPPDLPEAVPPEAVPPALGGPKDETGPTRAIERDIGGES